MVWQMLIKCSRIPLTGLIRAARESRMAEREHRAKTIEYISRSLLEQTAAIFLFVCYLVAKILFIINAVAHVYYVCKFTGTNYLLYGLAILVRMMAGQEWTHSERFPRVIWCDFKLRGLKNEARYSVECGMLYCHL